MEITRIRDLNCLISSIAVSEKFLRKCLGESLKSWDFPSKGFRNGHQIILLADNASAVTGDIHDSKPFLEVA